MSKIYAEEKSKKNCDYLKTLEFGFITRQEISFLAKACD